MAPPTLGKEKRKRVTITVDPETWERCQTIKSKVNISWSGVAQQAYEHTLQFVEKVAQYLDDEDKEYPILIPHVSEIPLYNYDVSPEVIIPKSFYNISDEDATPEDLERCIYVYIVEKEPEEDIC
ncbi:MAG: hypothetical protein WA902_24315 [Thermosynechococcaceae cyanobacterium]